MAGRLGQEDAPVRREQRGELDHQLPDIWNLVRHGENESEVDTAGKVGEPKAVGAATAGLDQL